MLTKEQQNAIKNRVERLRSVTCSLNSLDREIDALFKHIGELEKENESLLDKLQSIKSWITAYLIRIFPEPDLKKATEVLKQAGMTLDAVSASNMRHVLSGVKSIIENSKE